MIKNRRKTVTRVIKLLISTLVLFGSWFIDLWRSLLGNRLRPSYVVIYYHSIPHNERGRFARQMDIMLKMARPVSALAMGSAVDSRRCVVVTFDDGLQSVFDNALPELIERQIPATLFIITGAFGLRPFWLTATHDSSYDHDCVVGESQLQLLPPLFTIGSHSMSHPNLTTLPDCDARGEIRDSRERLEKLLGHEVAMFSFPFGAYDERLLAHCREAGYKRVFTTIPTPVNGGADHFVVGRVRVDPDDWTPEFRLKLLGAYRWLPAALAIRKAIRLRLTRRSSQRKKFRCLSP